MSTDQAKKYYTLLEQTLMTDTIKDALEVVERWSTAFTQSDTDTVMSLFATDAVFIGTTSKTLVTNPEGIRHYFESSLVQTKRYVSVLTDIVINTVSDDVATVTALNKITITENNHTELAPGRLSIVLSKREATGK